MFDSFIDLYITYKSFISASLPQQQIWPLVGLEEAAAGAITVELESKSITEFDEYIFNLKPEVQGLVLSLTQIELCIGLVILVLVLLGKKHPQQITLSAYPFFRMYVKYNTGCSLIIVFFP